MDSDTLKRKFTENLTFLRDNISKLEDIVDSLIEQHVIDFDDRSLFLSVKKQQKDKIQEILQEVIKKRKFGEFINALMKTGQQSCVDELELNKEEYNNYIDLPEEDQGVVSTCTGNEVEKTKANLNQQEQIKELEEKNIKNIQEIESLNDIIQKLRGEIGTKTSLIKRLQKNNHGKIVDKEEKLAGEVKKLQDESKTLNEELRQKTEYVRKLEEERKHFMDLIEKKREEDQKQRAKEREEDKKERAEDRELFRAEINCQMGLILNQLKQQTINQQQTGRLPGPQIRSNRTSDLRNNRNK